MKTTRGTLEYVRTVLKKSYTKFRQERQRHRIVRIPFKHPLECYVQRQREADLFQKKVYAMNRRTHTIEIVFGCIVPKTTIKHS